MKKAKIDKKKRIIIAIICVCVLIVSVTAAYRIVSTRFDIQSYPQNSGDYVVLMHGIGGFYYSMMPLAEELHRQGYSVININYPSTLHDIPAIADIYLDSVITTCYTDRSRKIHFVTHSMGGIVLRYYLQNHRSDINLGRVVMLSPPNSGSEIADVLGSNDLALAILGPAVKQLGTDANSITRSLGPVDFELGIITGNNPGLLPGLVMIAGENDGIVAVKNARVEGMNDFEVCDESHTLIMMSKKVISDTVCFLREGKFKVCS